MEETGSRVPSATRMRVMWGGGWQWVSDEASGVIWSDAPESRIQRGQGIPEKETEESTWAELARPVEEPAI